MFAELPQKEKVKCDLIKITQTPNTTMSNSSELSLLYLRKLERQVSIAEQDKAAVVYWHHNLCHFYWFHALDKGDYKEELHKLPGWIRESTITNVCFGDNHSFNGITLYPLELRFHSLEFHAYMLLCCRGMIEDAYYTPYLFKSQSSCQGTLYCLPRSLINSRQT